MEKNYIAFFSASALGNKNEIAIADREGERRTTYGELDLMRRQIAQKLLEEGLKPGTPVMICIGRCREYVAAWLGILTAGCAVVPVIPEYPEARIRQIKEDCHARMILKEDYLSDIDTFEPAEDVLASPDTPAYIVYTSGSTGHPKGIMHTVRSLYHITCDPYPLHDMEERIIFAASGAFSFATCLSNILRPLQEGGTVHIISETVRRDAELLADYYLRHMINIGDISPQMLRHFRNRSPYLKRVQTAGEMLSNTYTGDYEIWNGYGASETGITSLFRVDRKYANTPIGKPLPGCEYLISENEKEPSATATEGELYVAGFFAQAYLNLPEQTIHAFRTLPDGRILFRSGDIVRKDNDGNYTYLNRIDWMVKINGQRVETLEIENVLKNMPPVKDAAVKAFTDNGQTWLCAFCVMPESLYNEGQLRSLLSEKLPSYMLPRFLVRLDALPLTHSGKIDRQSLARPSLNDYKAPYRAPANETEQALCDAFEKVLSCEGVGTDDSFFSLGGDSISVMHLTEQLEKAHHLKLNAADIFDCETPARIAERIMKPDASGHADSAVSDSASTEAPYAAPSSTVNPCQENDNDTLRIVPLTDSQRGILMECLQKPESTMYNIAFMLRLPKTADADRFADAVQTAAMRHPILFAAVRTQEGSPVLVPDVYPFTLDRFSSDNAESAAAGFVHPFDIENEPLYRFALCETPVGSIFLMDIHHILFDGTSLRILLRQIMEAYDGRPIPEERRTLMDVADAEQGITGTKAYADAQAFFRERFAGTQWDAGLIPDKNQPDHFDRLNLHAPENLDPDFVSYRTGALGIRKSALFMAAFAYALSVFRGTQEACFATVNNGRHMEGLSDTVGMFVRSTPVRFDIPVNGTSREFLNEVQRISRQTVMHDCISFAELNHAYGADLSVSFVYQSDLLSEIYLDGEAILPEELPANACQSDILCMVLRRSGVYLLHIVYNSGKYSEGLIRSLAETVFTVAAGLLTEDKLCDMPLVSAGQRLAINTYNSTSLPYDPAQTVQSILEKRIAECPDKVALVYGKNTYTYKQFDSLTGTLATRIRKGGIGPEDYVAILAPRNDLAVLAAWGVIRAGAALQMLDPAYPAERLNYMVSDSRARLLIADRALRPILTEYAGEVMYTEEIGAAQKADSHDRFISTDNAETASGSPICPSASLALIYTSGTTGKPKGSILENRNLTAFYHNHARIMEIDASSRVASYASFGFDAGLMDIITTPLAGAALYIIPDDIRLDLARMDAFFCENGITHAFMTTQVGRMFALETKCDTLKALLVGGEKLVPLTPPDAFRFINGYGPCETMAYICSHTVQDSSPVQPIGAASGNTKLYITDRHGRLLPPGAVGEMCIAGLQVGRGYLNQPEKTAQVFVSNPFTTEPAYAHMYKTGDDARLLPSGEMEYIGRRDGQVKIRGFRVELTEVEEIVRRFPGVADATVAAFDEKNGGKYLAAYVTGRDQLDPEQLRAFIRAEKPDYMVPAAIMQLESIPYTVNRKVDRRALPLPERKAADIVPPANDTESRILSLAAETLGHTDFGVTTDLSDAGLTSISALKLNFALTKSFGVPVRITDLLDNPTVRALAGFIAGSREQAVKSVPDSSCQTPDNTAASFPLLPNQQGVLLDSGTDGTSLRYNIPLLMKLSPVIDPEKLRQAVCTAIDAHPCMKITLFTDTDGQVLATRHDDAVPRIDILHTPALPDTRELMRPFTLIGEPLYRGCIYVTNDAKYLFMDVHHIISDGTSMAILTQDISRAYAGEALSREAFSVTDLAAEKAGQASDSSSSGDYYDKLLSGANTDCLPASCPEKDAKAPCLTHTCLFGSLSEDILTFCREHSISANAFFNAAFSYTLSEFLHADDVTYCTVWNGRSDPRLQNSFGMLVETLPVHCAADPSAPVIPYIQSIQKQLLSTMAHDMPFSEICSRYGVRPDIFFNYQGDSFTFDTLCGEKALMIPFAPAEAKAPLSAEIYMENGVFRAEFTCRSDMYCAEFLDSFAGAMKEAAKGMTRERRIGQISVMTREESERFDRMNRTSVPFEPIPAQTLFERRARSHPDRIAARDKNSQLTYAELNARADRIAAALKKLGTKEDEIIGMIMDRDVNVPAAELGILKSGSAFLPMLPAYPDERLSYCLRDAGCRRVIAPRSVIESKPGLFAPDKPWQALELETICAQPVSNEPFADNDGPQISNGSPNRLAYCIYTSGSTGAPKGVMIGQRSLSGFAQTAELCHTLDTGSAVLCMASISFDMSITEIFVSLCRGKTVYIAAEEEIHDLDLLRKAFESAGIDLIMMTPSFAWNLLADPGFEKALASLKAVILGAEAFQPALFDRLRAINPSLLIQNGYGPTECTQVCAIKTLSSGDHITVGRPFANMQFHVADKAGQLLPRYALGELIISGEGVCRGYINQPEKNAAAFTEINGKRAYRSGDLVRVNRDMEVEFGGRTDRQIKLRGFRIELDEIENVMQRFPGVTRAAVIVKGSGAEAFLAGYYTADRAVSPEALSAFMRERLTGYMVPAAMMQMEKMPVTQGGKLDRKALPEIRPSGKDRKRREPRKSLEQKITEVFRNVLNTAELWPDDNFFEVGGTSLSASRAVMLIKAEGHRIEYQDIFDHQTAADLAEYLESAGRENSHEVRSGQSEADRDASPHADKAAAGKGAGAMSPSAFRSSADDGETAVLKYNTMAYAERVERKPLGDVLLTGASGFLGAHILRDLMENETGHIICLLRRGQFDDVTTRLMATMVYYFEDDCRDAFRGRVTMMEGDITDSGLMDLCREIHFDTVINCAASVRHYANDQSIEKVNVRGAENMIALAQAHQARLIQISTTSVPGMHTEETWRMNLKMAEDQLFVIDDTGNQYIRSKFQAEKRVLEAIQGGLDAKIIRVGNLMGRYTDGEFQTNMRTNAFLNGLRGFVNIGKCPISHATDPMSFSPVDSTARAVVLLAGTNSMFTVFNADTRFTFDEMKVIDTINRCGITVRPAPDQEYYADYYRIMADPLRNRKVAALLTGDRPDVHPVRTENRFTANVLYRLGFSWPFTDDAYLERIIRSLDTMDFFGEE